jgi:excisionase family DNA binding protein
MADIQVYTTGEVAKFCNVIKMTVVRWIDRGELPAHQLPGRGDRRVTREDLLTFMRTNNFPIPPELEDESADVLIVEDEPNLAKAIRRALMGGGYKVQIASDGFMAGSMLERIKPALVTLDMSMPGMSGLEVLKLIREREDLKNTKVLVISALPTERLREALAAGADQVMSKPFQNAKLQETVRELIGERKR